MGDEAKAILEILEAACVLDFALGKVESESELVELFKNDFAGLMRVCAIGG